MGIRGTFEDRHIGPDHNQIEQMLGHLGEKNLQEFVERVVPANIQIGDLLARVLPSGVSEVEAIAELRAIAQKNEIKKSYIGTGYYGTIIPPVVLRNVLENPAFYTAYTPYQPEISQGRLEAIFAFQTAVSDLTGLAISNASMLDEGTAAAEAMTLARRLWKGSDDAAFLIDTNLHPHVKAVIYTRAKPLKLSIIESEIDFVSIESISEELFGGVIAQFSTYGEAQDLQPAINLLKKHEAITIIDVDLLAATLYKSAGEWGADVAIGSAQRFGVPVGFGGPHAGFMAVRTGLERSLPGRLVGQSVDSHGNPAFRLALQTREQHIRRDKATSNICTAQVLLAVISAFYTMWHGPDGLKEIATRVRRYSHSLRSAIETAGFTVTQGEIFDTFTISGNGISDLVSRAQLAGINLRVVSDEIVGISIDETVTQDDLIALAHLFGTSVTVGETDLVDFIRESAFLTHPLYSTYGSETSMLRYLRTLADRDLALDRTMIPLGSCTMKLNATSEMIPVTWPEFSSIHPFSPADQSVGYREMISQLSEWLVKITGYDAVSLQPNAGSQGEFAGLLAIRGYLDARGESHRDICLIPSSAHGTNAASAVMAGMRVVVVACDDEGNVSIEDLKAKISEYRDVLAALMVTYPSTHGVFESAISQICELIHEAGGQVYVDGANLNALVGTAQPGKFGADVSHLNLHKTFCIPHGGGGPGVGPVIARAHLAPHLPNHSMDRTAGPETGPGAVSSAPFGSASILPISWMYIRMMGGEGLIHATQVAILSANYIAKKLDEHFPVLYKGQNGYIAHECIIDLREITKNTGVSVDDVAKRLMDHGFHAPTVSFPVAGTMMIEPTESEDLRELDRFIDAMIAIRHEISAIEAGTLAIEQSPLRYAPHTAKDLLSTSWDRSYSREIGAFPEGAAHNAHGIGAKGKYWPTVGRIDGVFGDRNLVCSCPPIEELSIN
jgi:glycine dehydrogenase